MIIIISFLGSSPEVISGVVGQFVDLKLKVDMVRAIRLKYRRCRHYRCRRCGRHCGRRRGHNRHFGRRCGFHRGRDRRRRCRCRRRNCQRVLIVIKFFVIVVF